MGPEDASPDRRGSLGREGRRVRLVHPQGRTGRPRLRPRRPPKDRTCASPFTQVRANGRTRDTPPSESSPSSTCPRTRSSSSSARSTRSSPTSSSRPARPRVRRLKPAHGSIRLTHRPLAQCRRPLGCPPHLLRPQPAGLLHRPVRCLASLRCRLPAHLGPSPRHAPREAQVVLHRRHQEDVRGQISQSLPFCRLRRGRKRMDLKPNADAENIAQKPWNGIVGVVVMNRMYGIDNHLHAASVFPWIESAHRLFIRHPSPHVWMKV